MKSIKETVEFVAAHPNSDTDDDQLVLYNHWKVCVAEGIDALENIRTMVDSTTFGNFQHWWIPHFKRIVHSKAMRDPKTLELSGTWIRKQGDGQIDFIGARENSENIALWDIDQYKYYTKSGEFASLALAKSDLDPLLTEASQVLDLDPTAEVVISLWSYCGLTLQAHKWWDSTSRGRFARLKKKYGHRLNFHDIQYPEAVKSYDSLWSHYGLLNCSWTTPYVRPPLYDHQRCLLQTHGQRMLDEYKHAGRNLKMKRLINKRARNKGDVYRLLIAWSMQLGKTREAAELILMLWDYVKNEEGHTQLNIAWLCQRVALVKQVEREMRKYIGDDLLNFCHTTNSDDFSFKDNKINFIASSFSFLLPTNSADLNINDEVDDIDVSPIEKDRVVHLLHDRVFDMLIVDECHLHFAAEKSQTNVKKLRYRMLIALSATPQRGEVLDLFDDNEIDYIDEDDILQWKSESHPDYQGYPAVHNVHYQLDFVENNSALGSLSVPGIPNLTILMQPENRAHLRDLAARVIDIIANGIMSGGRHIDIHDVMIRVTGSAVIDAFVEVIREIIAEEELETEFAVKGFSSVISRSSYCSSNSFDEEVRQFLNKMITPSRHRIIVVDRQGIEGYAYGWVNCTMDISEGKDYKLKKQFDGRSATRFVYPNGNPKTDLVRFDFSQERPIVLELDATKNKSQMTHDTGNSFERRVGRYSWLKFKNGSCVELSDSEIIQLGYQALATRQDNIVRDTIFEWSGEETTTFDLSLVNIKTAALKHMMKNPKLDSMGKKSPSKRRTGPPTKKTVMPACCKNAYTSNTVKFMIMVKVASIMLILHALRDPDNTYSFHNDDGTVNISDLFLKANPVLVSEHLLETLTLISGEDITVQRVVDEIQLAYTPELELFMQQGVKMLQTANDVEIRNIMSSVKDIKDKAFGSKRIKTRSEVFTGEAPLHLMKEIMLETAGADWFSTYRPICDPFVGAGNLLFGATASGEGLGAFHLFKDHIPNSDPEQIMREISGGDLTEANVCITRVRASILAGPNAVLNFTHGDSFERYQDTTNTSVAMNSPWNNQLYCPSLELALNVIQGEDQNFAWSWNPTPILTSAGKYGARFQKFRQSFLDQQLAPVETVSESLVVDAGVPARTANIVRIDIFDRDEMFPNVSTPGQVCLMTFSNAPFTNSMTIVRRDIKGHTETAFVATNVQFLKDGSIPLPIGDLGNAILLKYYNGQPVRFYKTIHGLDNKHFKDAPDGDYVHPVVKSFKEYPNNNLNYFYTNLLPGHSTTIDTPFGRNWIAGVKNKGVGDPLQHINVLEDAGNEYDGCQNLYHTVPSSDDNRKREHRYLLSNVEQFACLQRRSGDSQMVPFFDGMVHVPHGFDQLPVNFTQEELYDVCGYTDEERQHIERFMGRSVWEINE